MTSPDLVSWSYPRVVIYPDERDLPDYDHASVFRYGSHFLMLYAAMDGALSHAWQLAPNSNWSGGASLPGTVAP